MSETGAPMMGEEMKADLMENETKVVDLEGRDISEEEYIFSKSLKNLIGFQKIAMPEAIKSLESLKPDETAAWLTTENFKNSNIEALTVKQQLPQQCCIPECKNNQTTAPDKVFYSLPTRISELSSWLILIGLSDLVNNIAGDPEKYQQLFICSDHIFSAENTELGENEDSFMICPITETLSNLSVCELDPCNFDGNDEMIREQNAIKNKKSSDQDVYEEIVLSSTPEMLCRLCGIPTSIPIYLYSSEKVRRDGISLAEMINLCLPVKISTTDSLPKQICVDCKDKIDICYELALIAMKTQARFSAPLNETKKFSIKKESDGKNTVYGGKKIKFRGKTKPAGTIIDASNENLWALNRVESLDSQDLTNYGVHISSPNGSESNGEDDIESTAETLVGEEPVNCLLYFETEKKKKERRQLKRSYNAIERISPQIEDFFSEDLSDDGRPLKQLKLDENYEDWFECNMCFTTFSTRENLNLHLNRHRQKTPIKNWCDFCHTEFSRKSILQKHIATSHNEEYLIQNKCFKCIGCCRVFTKEDDAFDHASRSCNFAAAHSESKDNYIHEVYVGNVYVCEFCNECFTLPTTLHDHRNIMHMTEDFYCSVCSKSFHSRTYLMAHREREGHLEDFGVLWINRYFVCKYCNKTFLHYSSFLSHMAQHQGKEPYLCRICSRVFSNYNEVAAHRDNAHSYQLILQERISKSYVCHYCQKEFNDDPELAKHMRTHTVAPFSRKLVK